MVLLGSSLALLASAAGLVTLSSSYILGEVSAVAFAVSLFILICATEGPHLMGTNWRTRLYSRRRRARREAEDDEGAQHEVSVVAADALGGRTPGVRYNPHGRMADAGDLSRILTGNAKARRDVGGMVAGSGRRCGGNL